MQLASNMAEADIIIAHIINFCLTILDGYDVWAKKQKETDDDSTHFQNPKCRSSDQRCCGSRCRVACGPGGERMI
ncbi:hypothetical protein ACFL6B_04510 [Thermodesulfobacteriota bacterium]